MLPNPSSNLQVSAGTGMSVVVSPGFAIVNGCLKLEETQRTLAIQTPGATYDRIDTVVMRLDDNDNARNCDLYVLEGTPALSPVRPELTRTGSVWEIGLADIFVAKNTAAVSNQRITDTRYETSRCGVISSISRFDTTTIYQQVQSDLAEFKESEQAEFMEWFTNLQSQLDENAAANLQNQIGTLSTLKTENIANLVSACNEIVDKIGGTDISGIGDGTVSGAIALLKTDLINMIYPVGSIYMSVNNVSPASFLGGTWVQITDKFLLAAGSKYKAGTTGGSASHTHDLPILSLQNNTGNIGALDWNSWNYINKTKIITANHFLPKGDAMPESYEGYREQAGYTSTLPPYLSVYMWKRTA